jgi:hypothetical protein
MTQAELLELVVVGEGWVIERADHPERHPDALGERVDRRFALCQACKGDVLAVKPGTEADAYYQAAHEIAETRYGFEHGEEMWIEQCNILARFCERIAIEAARDRGDVGAGLDAEGPEGHPRHG